MIKEIIIIIIIIITEISVNIILIKKTILFKDQLYDSEGGLTSQYQAPGT